MNTIFITWSTIRKLTCQCEDEHLNSCKIGKFIGTRSAHYGHHTNKHHSPNSKPSVEESDNKHLEKVDDTEGEDDKANQLEKKDPVEIDISYSEIGIEDDTEAQDDKADQLEEEEHVEMNIPDSKVKGSHDNTRVYIKKVTDEKESNVEKRKIQRKEMFSAKL